MFIVDAVTGDSLCIQGCGKTTLTSHLQSLFSIIGKRVAVLSLDDFYLTAEKQEATAAEHPTNPLLRYRGNGMQFVSFTHK